MKYGVIPQIDNALISKTQITMNGLVAPIARRKGQLGDTNSQKGRDIIKSTIGEN